MLQIYLYGPFEQGFLDIDPSTKLSLEGLAEAWDEDLSTGEFSLPGEIAWTDRNRRLFGFSERLENYNTRQNFFKCDIYDDLCPELISAKITILEKSGLFMYTKGNFNVSISGGKGLFGSAIKNKSLRDLVLGGKVTWADDDSREFAQDVMMGVYPDYNYFAFAPVAIEDFIDTGRKDYDNEFLARDTVNTVIITGAGANDWIFGRPTVADPDVPATSGTTEYLDYRTIPFFKIKYVLKKIFEEIGFAVTGDFLDNTDFDDLYLFNNFAIENYAPSTNVDFSRFILPSNHVPDILITDFLKAAFSFFNIFPRFLNNSEIKLVYREKNLADRTILSLTGIVSRQFTSTNESISNESGYKLSYNWDSNDQFYSDRVKDLKEKTLVATVAVYSSLATLDIGRTLTTDDIAYVEAENMYYSVADATGIPILWDVYAENLNDYSKGNAERDVDLGMSTLCTYVEFNSTSGLFERRNYLGTRQPGSYRANLGTQVTNDFGLRIFYIKKRLIGTNNIPVSFNHSRDNVNNKVVPYSLALNGQDAIVPNLHKTWQDLKEKAEIVKTSIRADQKVIAEMKASNTLEINSVLFLPYKTERTIPMDGTVNIEMVPL